MESVTQWITEQVGISPENQLKMLWTVVTIIALGLLRTIVLRMVARSVDDVRARYRWTKGTRYVTVVTGFLVLGRIWIGASSQLGTFLGLLSAGLAIALRDPIVNMAGWFYIVWKRPFAVGDRVEVPGHAGDVIDVGLFQFTLNEIGNWVDADQSTGRIIHIPNRFVFEQPQANFTHGFAYIWNEVNVVLTFESNWQKAKHLFLDIATRNTEILSETAQASVREAASRFMIFYQKLSPAVYTKVKDHGIQITLRFLCEPRKRRGLEAKIWEELLRTIAEHHDLELAYPTVRVFRSGETVATTPDEDGEGAQPP